MADMPTETARMTEDFASTHKLTKGRAPDREELFPSRLGTGHE